MASKTHFSYITLLDIWLGQNIVSSTGLKSFSFLLLTSKILGNQSSSYITIVLKFIDPSLESLEFLDAHLYN